MREFAYRFREGLTQGLRPTAGVPRGTQAMALAQNAKPLAGGMVHVPVPQDIQALEACAWPYPQVFALHDGLHAASETAIHKLVDGVPVLELGELPVGGAWSCADFIRYQVWTNGEATVVRNPDTGLLEVYQGEAVPLARSVCAFNGQAVAGGLLAGWLGGGPDFAAWSGIGSVDFRPDQGTAAARNTAGLMPVAGAGEIWAVRKLGEHVMVYGSRGISALMPAPAPVATFGQRAVFPFGLAGARCQAGSDRAHYFLDESGHLWRLTDNHALTRFNFRSLLAPLLDDPPVVLSHDPNKDEVYVCNSQTGYVLTPQGLGGPLDTPLSDAVYARLAGGRAGLVAGCPSPLPADREMVLVTEAVDLGNRAIKTAYWLEVAGETDGLVETALDYRYGQGDPWARTPWRPTTPEGAGHVAVSGVEFRLCVRITGHARARVDYLILRWKASDRRFRRGMEAGEWTAEN